MGHLGLLTRLLSLLSGVALLFADSAPPPGEQNQGSACVADESFLRWYHFTSTCGDGASGMVQLVFSDGGPNEPPAGSDILVEIANPAEGSAPDFALTPQDPEFTCPPGGTQRRLTDLSLMLQSNAVTYFCVGFDLPRTDAEGTSTMTCMADATVCTLNLELRR